MTVSLKHTTQAVGPDAGNGEIRMAQWNEDHTLTLGASSILGRAAGTAGAAEEITLGANLEFFGLTLQTTFSTTDVANWNEAYGWGNHATAGYLTDYTVTTEDLNGAIADTAASGSILFTDLFILGRADESAVYKISYLNMRMAFGAHYSTIYSSISHNHSGVYEPADATILKDADIGVNVQGYDAGTLKADVGDVLTAGFTSDSYARGTISSGTVTPAPDTGEEAIQHYTNNGAHTLAPPASPCTVVIEVTNGASAGTITTSGFTMVTGDALTTTNGDDFILYITKTQNFSHLNVVALQ